MIVTFLCPSSKRPIGGNIALYHFANALARRGHRVQIAHLEGWVEELPTLEDLAWFEFEPSVTHWFHGGPPAPPADAVVGTGLPREAGLPVLLVQGIDMLHPWLERKGIRTPSRKICVASWLADVGTLFGVSRDQFAVVPCGIDHTTFRQLDPGAPRPIDVAALYHHHEAKGWDVATDALRRVRAARPGARILVFGATRPGEPLPEGVEFLLAPDHPTLAGQVYNRTKVFLQASHYEGFGLTAVEAMACGAALVTTDNGGSRDYAFDGRTARVSPRGDGASLAAQVLELLDDEAERSRLAEAGRLHVQSFDWDHSGELLEAAIEEYLAEPERFLVEPGEDLTLGADLATGDLAAAALAASPSRR